jgi:hypothetical protein
VNIVHPVFWTYGVWPLPKAMQMWPLPKAMQIDIFIVFAYNIAELNISEFDFTISAQKGVSGCLSAENKNWHY